MSRRKILYSFLAILILPVVIVSIIAGVRRSKDKNIIVQKDTIYIEVVDSTLAAQNLILYNQIDSLENIINIYDEELTVALIKLERIRDYNNIAAKGNNIKYLRGWINRVLND